MPTLGLKPQQDGMVMGYDSFVGASFAYQAVDDSDGTTHDSDTSYILIPRTGPVFNFPQGRISFPMFLQAEGLIPRSIVLNAVTKRNVGGNPDMQLGFYKGGIFAFDFVPWTPGAAYTVESRTFLTNPLTGLAWTAADLAGLEVCVGNVAGASAGKNRVTLLSGTLDFYPSTNRTMRLPRVAGMA